MSKSAMKVDTYTSEDGREWTLHGFRNPFTGDEMWCGESMDESGDVAEATTRAELVHAIAALVAESRRRAGGGE